ncbi:MAG: HisA/HisF-related TIM barrel protein [Gemmataceae bacterium]
MQIIPVMDILDGCVVRGIGGVRENYRPIVSKLTTSTTPDDVARAIHDQFGLSHFYVADLDAIAGKEPAWDVYRRLRTLGFDLSVDAGIRSVERAALLHETAVSGIILGLETLVDLDSLKEIVHLVGRDRLVFSLDLKGAIPLVSSSKWEGLTPMEIGEAAVGCGVQKMIVLDLVQVGTGKGNATEGICSVLARAFPDLQIITGGGIRGRSDVERLRLCGVNGVLIASALHDGRLTPEDLLES